MCWNRSKLQQLSSSFGGGRLPINEYSMSRLLQNSSAWWIFCVQYCTFAFVFYDNFHSCFMYFAAVCTVYAIKWGVSKWFARFFRLMFFIFFPQLTVTANSGPLVCLCISFSKSTNSHARTHSTCLVCMYRINKKIVYIVNSGPLRRGFHYAVNMFTHNCFPSNFRLTFSFTPPLSSFNSIWFRSHFHSTLSIYWYAVAGT